MSWSGFIEKVSPIVKNKFIIAGVAFLVWLTIFDQNNLIDSFKLSARIRQLEKERTHYKEEIEQNNRKMEELQSSTDNLEKFAREEYLMKKKDEVVFVIREE